ncbi:MAG: Gfo/Idh/MocA family oxidoreductase [Candidatus Omnitrophica bacterium]|nr:Gfo/Idh/MocA family oxidoreductase [Candidatus Omnitrophota bacterium]
MNTNRREFLAGAAALTLAGTLTQNRPLFAEKKKYKACVIGDTNQGGYGHGLHLVWSGRDNIEVVGLADPDPEGRKKHAEEAGANNTYADYREMLDKEKPDLVSIGPRWTIHHKEYLLACASAGAHGYLEKPISTDLAEADAMVEAVQSKNLKWSIAHQKRMCPDVQLAKKLIFEDGLIGDVLELRGRGKEDHRAGGEDLIVLGTHIFDLMLFFMGRAHWCASNIAVDGKPATKSDVHQPSEPLGPILGNQIQSTFGFDNAVPGFFATRKNKDGNGGRWGLDIYGSKGIVKIRMEVFPEIYWKETSSWLPTGENQKPWVRLPGHVELSGDDPSSIMNAFAIDDLLEAIEEDRQPGVSLESGRDSYEMIQAVYAAYINGGRIDLPLKDRRHPLVAWSE